jgi:hypothetical protein
LLIRIPAAEPAVSRQRNQFDAAAGVGVPAHVTIAYPFKPVELLTRDDMDALTRLFHRFQPVEVTFPTTAWFGDEVLYLEPANPLPLSALTAAVEGVYPEYPIYGGAHEVVHPHLTVGHSHDRDALTAAERDLLEFLPVKQLVNRVELWRGPPPATGLGRWTHVKTFHLGRTPST